MFRHRIDTEIEIAAAPERVWAILADFARYPEWNPFIRSIDGRLEEGARLTAHIVPPNGRGMTFRPRVTALEPARELRWLGRLGVPGIFDGEHRLVIEPLADGRTKLRHSESFRGVLVPMLAKSLDTGTRAGFEAMNRALKARVEASQ
jgi:hypothetical protein